MMDSDAKEYGKAFETLALNLHNSDFEVGQIAYLLRVGRWRYTPEKAIKVEVVEKLGDGKFKVKVLDREKVLSPNVNPPEDEDILMWASFKVLISEEQRANAIAAKNTPDHP